MHRPKFQEFFPGSRNMQYHTLKQFGGLGVEGTVYVCLTSAAELHLSPKKEL
jgi:hypothetical protein